MDAREDQVLDVGGADREMPGSLMDEAWPVDDDGWERDTAPDGDIESSAPWSAIRLRDMGPHELDAQHWFG